MYQITVFKHLETFPISRDPPEGGTCTVCGLQAQSTTFPISRDPPEGGTCRLVIVDPKHVSVLMFPISRDPPEGGTTKPNKRCGRKPKRRLFPISRDPTKAITKSGSLFSAQAEAVSNF